MKKISIAEATHEEWLALRKLGGSDAGAICGLNIYKTPLDVYNEKLHLVPPVKMNSAMEWGIELEDAIATKYARDNGLTIQKSNFMFVHDIYDFMTANVDRLIKNDIRGVGILEIKTMNADTFKRHHSKIPESHIAQVLHYMYVTGYTWARIVMLVGSAHLVTMELEEKDYAERMKVQAEKCINFWYEHIEPQIPPEDEAQDEVKTFVALENDEQKNLFMEYKETAQKLSELEKIKKELKSQIDGLIGDADEVKDSDGNLLATNKLIVSKKLDTKILQLNEPEIYNKYLNESSYRRFDLVEEKKGF